MGQLRVISWNTLGLTQQASDQHFVDRIFPIGGPDDAFHDHPVAVDQITLRYAEDVVRLPDRATGVVEDVERESQVVRERPGTHVRHPPRPQWRDRKSTRLNSSHVAISYAVFRLKKKKLN